MLAAESQSEWRRLRNLLADGSPHSKRDQAPLPCRMPPFHGSPPCEDAIGSVQRYVVPRVCRDLTLCMGLLGGFLFAQKFVESRLRVAVCNGGFGAVAPT